MNAQTETKPAMDPVMVLPMKLKDIVGRSDKNVRNIQPSADEARQMAKSVKANGILMPLLVEAIEDGYFVIDGWQRYKAAKEAGIETAPAIVINGDDQAARLNLSLVPNLLRKDMHPVDVYKAVHALQENGWTNTMIMHSLGLGKKTMAQVAALGGLSSKILDAYADGKIVEDGIKAFTLVALEEQDALLDKLRKEIGDRPVNRWDVVHQLGARRRQLKGKLDFIGFDNYAKAGGTVRADLFGDDDVINNPEIIDRLYEEHFEKLKAELLEDGWAEVLTERPNDLWKWTQKHVVDEEARKKVNDALRAIDEMEIDEDEADKKAAEAEAQFEADMKAAVYKEIPKEERSKYIVIVSIDYEGEVKISYGWVRPKLKKGETVDPETGEIRPAISETTKPDKFEISHALAVRLSQYKWTGTRTAIINADGIRNGTLASMCRAIVADLIKPEESYNLAHHLVMSREKDLLEAIKPEIVRKAYVEAFNPEDYFGALKAESSKYVGMKIFGMKEADLPSKKADLVSALCDEWRKMKPAEAWLPEQLRHPHYAGNKKNPA